MKRKARKQQIQQLVEEFKNDKINKCNIIVDLLKELERRDTSVLKTTVSALHKIFSQLFQDGDIVKPSELPEDLQTAQEKYGKWLMDCYEEMTGKLLMFLVHSDKGVQEISLCALIKLMQKEGQHLSSESSYHFPIGRLKMLLSRLVLHNGDHRSLLGHLKESMECIDFQFYTLKVVSDIVKSHSGKTTECYLRNLFAVIEQVNIPPRDSKPLKQPPLFLLQNKDEAELPEESPFTFSYDHAQEYISTIWLQFIRYLLTPDLYRRSLVIIADKVMHHLKNPKHLTDFYIESYNLGGVVSLLALQGVFLLVNKYNLEYPDFYTKLYALLDMNILHAKYKPRFFMLCEKFLGSPYLPEYLLAAFIKKFARLTLYSPASSLVLLIKFIVNLLHSYPNLLKLIDNPNAKSVESDPFDFDEPDPAKSRACESSLWEIATLKSHAIPEASEVAGFINKNLPNLPHDISKCVEDTYDEMFDKTTKKRKTKEVPTTFHKPSSLFKYAGDQMSDFWELK